MSHGFRTFKQYSQLLITNWYPEKEKCIFQGKLFCGLGDTCIRTGVSDTKVKPSLDALEYS